MTPKQRAEKRRANRAYLDALQDFKKEHDNVECMDCYERGKRQGWKEATDADGVHGEDIADGLYDTVEEAFSKGSEAGEKIGLRKALKVKPPKGGSDAYGHGWFNACREWEAAINEELGG